jgi:hypothetical protein
MMMMTISYPSKVSFFPLFCLLSVVVDLAVVADVVEPDNGPVDVTDDNFALRRTMTSRFLQDTLKIDDESFPLYQNTLILSTTTPWDEDVLLDCVDDNYTYTTNEENFTWYGLRIILPEDALVRGHPGLTT